MFFSRKADGGLSMGFVVILAISLIVMIVIIGIFTGRARDGNRSLQSCEAGGGACVQNVTGGANPCAGPEYIAPVDRVCPSGQVCCQRAFDFQ